LKPAINCITLAGDDLKKSLAFYRDGLGLPAQFSAELEDGADCTAFELAGDLWLVLMPRAEFAKCTKIAHQPDAPRGSSECILSYFAASKEDVAAILKRANAAGGAVPGEAEDQPWGYSGYFTDPDGHLWEIMWKPTLVIDLLNSVSSAAFACHPSLSSTRHHSRSSYGLGGPLNTVKQKCTLLYENQIKTDNTLCERADQRLEGLRKAGDD
jgi:predicted lactoylglutathione lyase